MTLQKICRVLKQDLEYKKNHKSSTDSISVANDEFDGSEASAYILLVSSGTDSLLDCWILDYTCS
jgi:hypothetical protein